MSYNLTKPAASLFDSSKKVNLSTYGLQPETAIPWTIASASQDEVRLVGPTGYGTPTTLILHANQISDWYANKKWVDASAIPPVRSATRINATYTENMTLTDSANVLDTKVLPCQVSLNVTVPNVDNIDNREMMDFLARATGAIFSTYAAESSDPQGNVDYENVVNRIYGVLKPKQFSNK